VMHADRKIRNLMAERRSIYNQVTELTNRIKNGGMLREIDVFAAHNSRGLVSAVIDISGGKGGDLIRRCREMDTC
ncbi:hypothetical protein, partial [Streptomyces luteogriseus]|uniref:hypothetical protein n=1 Tax=Streptomyces luteogriseus TaxID=68233 RepID=UPI0036A3BB6A